MLDVNKPFTCECGSDRFVRLQRWNDYCCMLQEDPDDGPLMIQCASCQQLYQQTVEWSWVAVAPVKEES